MQKYLEKTGEMKFEKIFNQKLGLFHQIHLWLTYV